MLERNPLARLSDFGQSVWCDDIGRDLLLAGRLQTLIEEDGVSGVTSNPTIFYRAITESTAYDQAIGTLASGGASAAEIMEALMVDDIQYAADQLRPVYLATASRDGWVSIEVAPALAYDVQGTVSEALRLRTLVDRPNVMVKVPATEEGVAAVRDLTALGRSINVTLIFSLERYRQVMEAYLSGLEALRARRAAGEDVPAVRDVHGVASFFVSRIDSAVDRRLDDLISERLAAGEAAADLEALRGAAAVASAKEAYRLFRETFSGPRWEALQEEGATVQRPLWASTSTKDPAYSDILYVQELIGPDTVNTMPLNTLDAFRDHGLPAETVTLDVQEAAARLRALEEAGIAMEEVAARLERDGVRAFAESFEALHAALEVKRG
jgi:transaldolase